MKNCKWMVIFAIVAVACKPDTKEEPKAGYSDSNAVFIGNEGPFSSGNATVDFYNSATKQNQKGIYVSANGVPAGSILNSMAQINDDVFLVMNNSQLVQVVNKSDFKQKGTITGFQSPRFMLAISASKAYVTDWVSNTVAVVNLNTNTISKSIPAGNSPEKMLLVDNQLFVVNCGGFGVDSTITVINTTTDVVDTTIIVGHNPNSLQLDANGDLWVLCGGINDWTNPANNTIGKFVKLKTSDKSLTMSSLDFASTITHPANLTYVSGDFYYLADSYDAAIMKWNPSQTTLPTTAFIQGTFYKIDANQVSGEIYASDALDYNSAGKIYIFKTDGTISHQFDAGIVPSSFLFN